MRGGTPDVRVPWFRFHFSFAIRETEYTAPSNVPSAEAVERALPRTGPNREPEPASCN